MGEGTPGKRLGWADFDGDFDGRESLQVLGVLRATRLVLGVLLARHGRRELCDTTEGAPHEVSN